MVVCLEQRANVYVVQLMPLSIFQSVMNLCIYVFISLFIYQSLSITCQCICLFVCILEN